MTKLKSAKLRLGSVPARLVGGSNTERKGIRRSDGPINTARWQRLRVKILSRDGWQCQMTGVLLVGTYPAPNSPVVDHITPHRGDKKLFWDEDNLRAVSKSWHDTHKQSLEKRGLA